MHNTRQKRQSPGAMLMEFRLQRFSDYVAGRITLSPEETELLEAWAANLVLSQGAPTSSESLKPPAPQIVPVRTQKPRRVSTQPVRRALSSTDTDVPRLQIPTPSQTPIMASPLPPLTDRNLFSPTDPQPPTEPQPPPTEREPPPPDSERSIAPPPTTDRSYNIPTAHSSSSSVALNSSTTKKTQIGESGTPTSGTSSTKLLIPTTSPRTQRMIEPVFTQNKEKHTSIACSTVLDPDAYTEYFGDTYPDENPGPLPTPRQDQVAWIATGVTKPVNRTHSRTEANQVAKLARSTSAMVGGPNAKAFMPLAKMREASQAQSQSATSTPNTSTSATTATTSSLSRRPSRFMVRLRSFMGRDERS
eukprot:c3043_g1_i1.p1 GENE.c3043_g1_i1~~c3043_g1_i1.p1  ORF type:complete len:376 (+),score=62.21 c3043_g1_i1:46-1128(+)